MPVAAVDSRVPAVGHAGCVGAGRGGVAGSADPSQRLPGRQTAESAEGEPTMEGQAPQAHGRNHRRHEGMGTVSWRKGIFTCRVLY